MPKNERTYKISSATLAEVRRLIVEPKPDYPAAYQAIADDLKAQVDRGVKIDQNTLTWYTDAAQINNPDATSFIHYFARDYVSDYAQLTKEKTIDNAEFQKVSNHLAAKVLGHISSSGEVPDFNTVGVQDTGNAVTQFGKLGVPVKQYAWPAYADLASFSWLRSFKNPTWLTNLTIKDQRNILFATRQAGESALFQSRANDLTLSDIVNAFSLEDKLLSIRRSSTRGAPRTLAGLQSKFPVKMIYYYNAKSQLAASKKRAPAHRMLHNIPKNPRSQPRSFAPVPGRVARDAPSARPTNHHAAAPPAPTRPHHAPPPTRARTARASFVPKIYHDPTGNLPPELCEYLRRLSRLPPNSGTSFDPRLTPIWAGLKLPG